MNKSSARNNILNRLRVKSRDSYQEQNPAPEPRPYTNRSFEHKIESFIKRAEFMKAEIHRVDESEIKKKLIEIIEMKNIKSIVMPGSEFFRNLARDSDLGNIESIFPDEAIESMKDGIFKADAGLTSVDCGIAQTGTLVVWPDKYEPRTTSLVPPIHIALLKTREIYESFSQVISAKNWSGNMPTNSILITGPSKTGDIEFTLVYGVHGPYELVIILIDD